MLKQVEELKANALQELRGVSDIKELESWRVRYLGRKSQLNNLLRGLATLPLEERKTVGAHANKVKSHLEESLRQRSEELKQESEGQSFRADKEGCRTL